VTTSACSPEPVASRRRAASLAGDGTLLTIDGYAELEPIGRGGLGDVYRARRRSTGATVAIKVLRDVSDTSVAWTRCRRELAALVALGGHAHVIGLVEQLGLASGPALVMEHAPGGSVADLITRRGGPLTVAEAALVGEHTADALVAAHARGIVHRDVKPQNLLIDAYGQVKLCDFGIAAIARAPEFRSRTSALSLRYASPEDLDDDGTDDREVGPPSDVYSLGATLLFVARGVHLDLRDRLAPWEPPDDAPPDLAALDAVVAACLRPTPAERPTAAEVLLALDRIGWSNPDRRRALLVPPPQQEEGLQISAAEFDRLGPPAEEEGLRIRDAEPDRLGPPPEEGLRIRDAELDRLGPPPADVTLARPGAGRRRPPSPSEVRRPAPKQPRRRARVAPAAAVLVAVTAAWWLARGDAPPVIAPAPAPRTVARPAGLADLTRATWPNGPVGECLVQYAGSDTLAPIDCNEPHDLERVAAGAASANHVDQVCADAAAQYLGVPPANVGMSVAATDDSGSYQCFVGIPASRLSGPAPRAAS